MRVRPIRVDGGTIFVEVIESDLSDAGSSSGQFKAEEVSAISKLEATQDTILTTVRGMATTVHNAFNGLKPAEWSIELNLAFAGGLHPIPLLVSADAHASVKIKATWKSGADRDFRPFEAAAHESETAEGGEKIGASEP